MLDSTASEQCFLFRHIFTHVTSAPRTRHALISRHRPGWNPTRATQVLRYAKKASVHRWGWGGEGAGGSQLTLVRYRKKEGSGKVGLLCEQGFEPSAASQAAAGASGAASAAAGSPSAAAPPAFAAVLGL